MHVTTRSHLLVPSLAPRRGRVLRVVGVARISTDHQDEKSLADQEALYRRWLDEHYDGAFELKMIATRGSGERLDREELDVLYREIESRTIDLILAEDLGRIVRRVHAVLICEACEDDGVRLIAINDHVDTGRPDWRVHSLFSSMRHEMYNKDTSGRIRRTQRNRFEQGGILRQPCFGYQKPPGAKHDSQLRKLTEYAWVIEGIFQRLEQGRTYSEISDWLNESNVPVGPAVRVRKWTGILVRNLVFNPLLKGVRQRNKTMSVRINKTGRRKSVKAPPEELLTRHVPELAFIDADRYDRLLAKLVKKGESYSIPKRLGHDPRAGRPKKRSRWPGQHLYCGICRRMYVYGGHGRKAYLMCSGARLYACWNGATVEAGLAAGRLSEAVFDAIRQLPNFDASLVEMVKSETRQLAATKHDRTNQVRKGLHSVDRAISNITGAIKAHGHSTVLLEELKDLEAQKERLTAELEESEAVTDTKEELPSIDFVRQEALTAFQGLAAESYEFARGMRQLIPRIEVFPVRLADGGNIELRAKFKLSLADYIPLSLRTPSVLEHLEQELAVDLFEMPERAKFLDRIIELRSQGMKQRDVGKVLGIFQPPVQRAEKLHKLMRARGLIDPYVPVTQPPDDYTKFRRHRHPRYRFDPLPPPDEAA
jgi:DNA invertase Pin-like site-specific DNA recombinase